MATYARDTDNLQPTALEIPEPKRTLEECTAILTAPGALHELTEATIRGRTMKVFKNAPPSISLFWQSVSSQFADREYLILEKERLTYREVSQQAFRRIVEQDLIFVFELADTQASNHHCRDAEAGVRCKKGGQGCCTHAQSTGLGRGQCSLL